MIEKIGTLRAIIRSKHQVRSKWSRYFDKKYNLFGQTLFFSPHNPVSISIITTDPEQEAYPKSI